MLGLERGVSDHKVALLPQKRPGLVKTCPTLPKTFSALAEDPTAVELVITLPIFIKWS